MDKEIKVFISSPYSNDWAATAVKRQMDMFDTLRNLGYYPFIPMLNFFLELYTTRPEHEWLEWDCVYVKTCDALLRIKPLDKNGNEILSPGADQEEATARAAGIPVFYSVEELHLHFASMV